MAPHQQRVVEEKNALDEKLEKLSAFLLTELFDSLPHAEQVRLRYQRYHMVHYSDVLGERIEAFSKIG